MNNPTPTLDWTLERPDGGRVCLAPTFACPHTRGVLVDEDEADPLQALWPLLARAEGALVDLAPAPGWAALAWSAAAPGRVALHEADAAARRRVATTLALNGAQAAVAWLETAAPSPGLRAGAVRAVAGPGLASRWHGAIAPWLAAGASALVLEGLADPDLPLLAALAPPGWRTWRFSAATGVLLPLDTVSEPAPGRMPVLLLSPAFAAALAAGDALLDAAHAPPAGPATRHGQALQALLQELDTAAALATGEVAVDLDAQRVLLLQALGRDEQAAGLARQVLARAPAAAGQGVPLPGASALAGVEPALLRQSFQEFVLLQAARPAPADWLAALSDPGHSARVERAALVALMAADLPPTAALLARMRHVPQACVNRTLWAALLDSARELAAQPPGLRHAAPGSAEQLLAELGEPVLEVVDVGASSLGDGAEPYAALARFCHVRVTGFEPDAEALAELQREHAGDAGRRYLPHFVGDGQDAVFHETNWSLTGSLLPPHRPVLDRYTNLGSLTEERARHPVHTVRLDDVIEPGGMDLLKIDVQGGEGRVFDGARARLAECLMVWTEVEFLELYQGQPLFADIDRQLRAQGLRFFAFVGMGQRALAGWDVAGEGLPAPRSHQQVWGDAVYLPTPERLATLDADRALRMALLAHHVLGAWDLCHEALQRHEAAGGTAGAARAYRERMRRRAEAARSAARARPAAVA